VTTIGVFDSGVGGLTVLTAMRRRLPGIDILYLGDTARLPYGSKSPQTVLRYARSAVRHLLTHKVDLIVVACNTASASALPHLSEEVPIPVHGVVDPGVDAALTTGARRIGVIGTEGTIRSGAYQDGLHRRAPDAEVLTAPCPLFVPLAEEGWGDHPVTDRVAEIYLRPLLDRQIEALILGCTHYPLLIPSLTRIAGPGVRLVDSAESVTEAVVRRHRGLVVEAPAGRGLLTIHLTDASERFLRIAQTILGEAPERLEVVDLPTG
jgi:glutamate racemase